MTQRSSSPPGHSLGVVHRDDHHCIATYGPVLIGVENSAPTIRYIDRVAEQAQRLSSEFPSGLGLLVVIRPDAPPPSEAVRSHILAVLPSFEQYFSGFAHVVEGEGFIASAKRSALTLLLMAARVRLPVKVFRSPAEGAPWLMTALGGEKATGVSVGRFVRQVNQLRDEQFARIPMSG